MAYPYPPWGAAAQPPPPRYPAPAYPQYRPPPPHGGYGQPRYDQPHGPRPKRPVPNYQAPYPGGKRPRMEKNANASAAFFCETCDRSFQTLTEFTKHNSEHLKTLIGAEEKSGEAGDATLQSSYAESDGFVSSSNPIPQLPLTSDALELQPTQAPPVRAPPVRAPPPDPLSKNDPYDDPYSSSRTAHLPVGPLALERDPYVRPTPGELRHRLVADRERYLAGLRALYPDPESFHAALEEDRARMLDSAMPPPPPPPPPRRPYARDPYDPYADDPYDPYARDYAPIRRRLPPRPRYRPYPADYPEEDYYERAPVPRRRLPPPPSPRHLAPCHSGPRHAGPRHTGPRHPGLRHRAPRPHPAGQSPSMTKGEKETYALAKHAIEESSTNDDKVTCPANNGCGRKYRNDQSLFHHWRESHQAVMWKFGCLLCETQSKRILGIRRHYVSEHGLESDDIMPWVNYVVVIDRKSKNQQFQDPKRAPPDGFWEWDDKHVERFTFKSGADPRLTKRLNVIMSVRRRGITGSGDVRTKQYQVLEAERTQLLKDAGIVVGQEPEEGSELAMKVQALEEQKAALCLPGPELRDILPY